MEQWLWTNQRSILKTDSYTSLRAQGWPSFLAALSTSQAPRKEQGRYKNIIKASFYLKIKEFGTQALFLGIHDALLREGLPRVKGAQPTAL